MKLVHLSDLHIGKRVHEFSMIEDQKYILKQIGDIVERVKADGVLIAGDVYDKTVPSAEAVQVFDSFLTRLSRAGIPVYMISGNHDSAERLSFGAELLKESGIHISRVYDGEVRTIESILFWSTPQMETAPSSVISILTPVRSMIVLMVLPLCPTTSPIF